jgi:outer membrane protein
VAATPRGASHLVPGQGAALAPASVDIPLAGGCLLNADAKWVQIGTDVRSSGVKVGSFKVDPWLLSLGAGYRF